MKIVSNKFSASALSNSSTSSTSPPSPPTPPPPPLRTANVATALASADKAHPDLAADVVREAMRRADISIARGVLLFLTPDFAAHAQAAVVAASRVANCLQVTGCTAPGILTEEDWALDRPAVCAMVFGEGLGLGAVHRAPDESSSTPASLMPLLTLATPATATHNWLAEGVPRYGLLSTDNSAQGAGRIWCHGKMAADGRGEASILGARSVIGVSRGVYALNAPLPVTVAEGYDIQKIGNQPALNTLLHGLPAELREMEKLPFHLFSAAVVSRNIVDGNLTEKNETTSAQDAIQTGRYTLVPIIGVNHEERSVTLAVQLEPGTSIFWTMRQALATELDMQSMVSRLGDELATEPDFGVLLSCMGRGPYFFGGEDRDLVVVKERFPHLPLIGAYGGGQIVPLFNGNHVVHNTAVLTLFKAE